MSKELRKMMQRKDYLSVLLPLIREQFPSFKITLVYFVIGGLWVLYSDQLLFNLINDQHRLNQVGSLKGILFVLLSSVILHILIYSSQKKIKTSNDFSVKAEEKIHYHTYYDSLTNLPNRKSLNERLNYSLSCAVPSNQQLALLLIDLDRFKNINDSLGHVIGDSILHEVAQRLRKFISEDVLVFRVGGDEFAIVLQNMADITEAAKIGQDVIQLLSEPFSIQEHEMFITPSIGISLYPSDGSDEKTLIRSAEAAMYRAKEMGRNNVQFFTSEMSAAITERLTLETSLRKAIEREEFIVYYQPQIDLRTDQIVGVEALVRWNHPELGILSPAKFISLAEETGLIVPIGEWVLHTACLQNKAWQDAGYSKISVSVNLSPRQFEDNELVNKIKRVLDKTGLEAKWLNLEVTEGVIMKDTDEAIITLHQIKSLGAQISLDDFGTGYSSLGYLKKFPIDMLKIDRSFLKDIPSDKTDASITRAIVNLAHSMNLCTVAEGVETEEQLAFLHENHCDHVQGFLISQPVTSERITEVLKSSVTTLSPLAAYASDKG
jgi:diguanylate cyclase (GGDEF)-like protein